MSSIVQDMRFAVRGFAAQPRIYNYRHRNAGDWDRSERGSFHGNEGCAFRGIPDGARK